MVKNRKIEDTEREALQVIRVGYRLFGLRVFGVPRFFPFFVSRSLFFVANGGTWRNLIVRSFPA